MQTTDGAEPAVELAGGHELTQARLVVATDAAQLGLWDWDLTDDSLVWDARSRALYGQAEMELTGLVFDINRTIHPADQAGLAAQLERCIASKGSLEVEFRVVHPDESERIVYARGQVLVDAEGRAVRMIGTNADVTELRRTQRRAVQDAQRTAGLVDVARALGEADDLPTVLRVVDGAARTLLGAQGVALAVAVEGTGLPPEQVRVFTTLSEHPLGAATAEPEPSQVVLPATTPLPGVAALTTGASSFFSDRAAGLTAHPGADDLWPAWVQGVATVPLSSPDGVFGSFGVTTAAPVEWRAVDQQLVDTFASLVAQALRRIWARAAEVAARLSAQRWAAQQATLVGLASSLDLASDEQEVLAVVTGGGVGLLGAQGTVLCLREGEQLRALTTEFFDEQVRADVAELPLDFPLPMVDAAVTGRAHFLADAEAAAALFGQAGEVTRATYAQASTVASAAVPLHGGGELIGSLSVGLAQARTWTVAEQQLLKAFAALTAQALERLRARAAEEAANAAVRRFSETLQRSLLTSPPEPDHLHVVVRYSPAATEAQVGGDWYDAFMLADGATCIVVGDVTGHDREAAAAMGQMRNLLRGIAHCSGGEPAQVLASLDAAVRDLDVGSMATVLLAKVVQTPEMATQVAAGGHRGRRVLRWSNAGHPPPLLLRPDGTTALLETEPDLLVGLMPEVPRHDHEVELDPGSTLLLYSDGLVERRGTSLTDGLDWLAAAVRELRDLDPEALCDELLRRVGADAEDDVALVVVRAHPEDEPRPPEAGPVVSPVS